MPSDSSSSPAGATGNFEFQALRWARNYRQALLREFAPHLKGAVIEVGAGIGQFSELVAHLPAVKHLLAVEPDPAFCSEFRQRLPAVSLLNGTSREVPPATAWDAIVTINVLEHIGEDSLELSHYAGLLRSNCGTLCLFVPARREIYAPLDKDFGHFRRYSKPELSRKLEDAGFRIERLHYFNLIGYFAWWTTFCLLRRRSFDEKSVRLFDSVIFPVVHAFESHVLRPPFGQSLLAVARVR